MKEKKPKKVVIINDIDSESIEKAILILRNGGNPEPQSYHIVTEAQEIINAYRKTVEKTQSDISRKEDHVRENKKFSAKIAPALWATGMIALFLLGGYVFLQGICFMMEKF